MDTRKVQSVGGGTYTVALPKAWSDAHGIAPGDTVNVHQHLDGVLAVQPQERSYSDPTQPTVRIAADETDRLEATLRAAYTAGVRQLTFEAPEEFTAAQRRIVDEVATTLTGVSVVDRSASEIVVRVLLDSDEISVSQSVRQLEFVALSMHETAIEAINTDATSTDIGTRDDQADRLAAMVDRSFLRGQARLDEVDALGYCRPALFELWATARELERVADHAEAIATVAPAIERGTDDVVADIHRFAEEARSVVSNAVGLIVDEPDADVAHATLVARDDLRGAIAAGRAATTEPVALDRVRHSISRTVEHGGNIAELGLQRAIRLRETAESPTDISPEQ